jgi:hypothetical protein
MRNVKSLDTTNRSPVINVFQFIAAIEPHELRAVVLRSKL